MTRRRLAIYAAVSVAFFLAFAVACTPRQRDQLPSEASDAVPELLFRVRDEHLADNLFFDSSGLALRVPAGWSVSDGGADLLIGALGEEDDFDLGTVDLRIGPNDETLLIAEMDTGALPDDADFSSDGVDHMQFTHNGVFFDQIREVTPTHIGFVLYAHLESRDPLLISFAALNPPSDTFTEIVESVLGSIEPISDEIAR